MLHAPLTLKSATVFVLRQAHQVNYIFLVGGFAESKLLLHRVRNEFEKDNLRVVVPLRPGLAVLRGAVMLGLGASGRFASRISRWTYGCEVREKFDASKPGHMGRKQEVIKVDGKDIPYVMKCFKSIVEKGTCIKEDDQHETTVFCSDDNQKLVTLPLYATPSKKARWVTDEGMTLLGSITIPATKGDSINVQLSFGRTEIRVVAVNEKTGYRRPTAIDYDLRAA
jgi:hypothetical protein